MHATPAAIPVDDYLRTNVEHIFAAGDVNGQSMVVQTARMEGRIAATNAIAGATRQASYDVVPSGSFTDPEYGRVGLTEAQAAEQHDVVVGIARYDDLLRPVADGRPDGFCKLIADRRTHAILGAHVLGEYSAETVQTVAACMAAGMTIEQVAELQLAFPTFTEGVSMAAQKICRALGIGSFPQAWSYLGPGRLISARDGSSQVVPLAHPHQGGPAPDRRQVGREQALDEDRGGGIGLRDTGRGEAEDHARFHHAHAAGRRRDAADRSRPA